MNNSESPLKKSVGAWQALSFVWDVLLAIAVPVVLLALGGRWLDRKLHTSPLFTAVSFLPALAIAFTLILRRARDLQKKQS